MGCEPAASAKPVCLARGISVPSFLAVKLGPQGPSYSFRFPTVPNVTIIFPDVLILSKEESLLFLGLMKNSLTAVPRRISSPRKRCEETRKAAPYQT